MQRLLFLVVCCAPLATMAQPIEKPNIVLLIGDDHGYPYFGFTGSPHVLTPNMDALAVQGAVFHLGHTTSNHCRPALQTLMTGLYPLQYEAQAARLHEEAAQEDSGYITLSPDARRRWDQDFFTQAMRHFTTLPALLAGAGYRSFQGGKWWEYAFANGSFTEGMSTGWPEERRGTPGWFMDFMGGEGLALTRETQQPVYEFIDRHVDTPFFLWYAPSLPHTPFDAPEKYTSQYADSAFSETAKAYYANCTWFDDGVGDLVSYIEEKGVLSRTLFVYVNDNGWEQEPYEEYADDPELSSNGGPKGKKSLHDLAFRTPIVFYWPGVIPPMVFEETPVSTVDIVPTILDFAGVPAPAGLPGHSLKGLIEGEAYEPRDALVGHVTGLRSPDDVMGRQAEGYYVRTARWHYIWYKDDGREALYDMVQDPQATVDVAADHAALVTSFRARIESWRGSLK